MTTFDRPSRALRWAVQTFGDVALDPEERAMRFLEEAIELGQSIGLNVDVVLAIVDRVYDRDPGATRKEIGQARLTLDLLSKAIQIDSDDEADNEFFRVQSIPKEEWERRHAAKKAIGIAS